MTPQSAEKRPAVGAGGGSVSSAKVVRFGEAPKVDRGNGIFATPLVNSSIGSEHMTSGTTSFEPGSGIALHTHNCDEAVCVVEGEAVAEIDGELYEVRPYDTTFVPAGVPHCFRNKGSRPMRILWSYASGHVTRTVVATGQTADHLSAADRPATTRDA
jgi:quercetin dioxygenase-like cupin family protein